AEYTNMTPLSMQPMESTYENFAFQKESSDMVEAFETERPSKQYKYRFRRSLVAAGDVVKPMEKAAREDGLVYTTIQFTENQIKKSGEPPPERETTEYVSIAFDRHVPPQLD
ncbi:hypothetical protein BaRGS_00033681, partial [Batillaria attramentaria]